MMYEDAQKIKVGDTVQLINDYSTNSGHIITNKAVGIVHSFRDETAGCPHCPNIAFELWFEAGNGIIFPLTVSHDKIKVSA